MRRYFNEEELNKNFQDTVAKNESVINDWNNLSESSKEWIKEHIDENNDFIIVDGQDVYISEDKKQYAKYQNYLRLNYSNDFSLINSFNSDKFGEILNKTWIQWSSETAKQLSKIKMCSYRDIIIDYFTNEDKEWLTEYPELADYVKYMSLEECNSLQFVKKKLKERVEDIKKSWIIIKNSFEKDRFYSLSTIKKILTKEFRDAGIKLAPKASLLEKCPYVECKSLIKRDGNKVAKGYQINNIYNYLFDF